MSRLDEPKQKLRAGSTNPACATNPPCITAFFYKTNQWSIKNSTLWLESAVAKPVAGPRHSTCGACVFGRASTLVHHKPKRTKSIHSVCKGIGLVSTSGSKIYDGTLRNITTRRRPPSLYSRRQHIHTARECDRRRGWSFMAWLPGPLRLAI